MSPTDEAPTALLISADLMASSSAEGAARQAGVSLRTVGPPAAREAAHSGLRFVALDLTARLNDLPELVADLRAAAPGVTLLAYGPHVQEARLEGARDSGFDLVISRGQFHRQIAELLTRYAADDG